MQKSVFKHTLDNGLTVLVFPMHAIPKVSVQLCVRAGSAHEKRESRGAAHFLEHLLFKGTSRLSETDVTSIVDKLSGYCNAFTSHDYTVYQFDFPRQHWTVAGDLLADMLVNMQIKSELFNSEKCAVIQELKMYKDDYATMLEEEMVSLMFSHHPYYYPVIGYKQDLWGMTIAEVLRFYRDYYVPNNATLIVVGDVVIEEVVATVQRYFGHICPGVVPSNNHHQMYIKDLLQGSVTLYRDVEQSSGKIGFIIPGAKERIGYQLDVVAWILGRGRGSRLYKKLVDQLEYATDVDVYILEMFERSAFFIDFDPKEDIDNARIEKIIFEELRVIQTEGIEDYELERAMNQVKMEYLLSFEDYAEVADLIGRLYLATEDHEYILRYLNMEKDALKQSIQKIIAENFSKNTAYTGSLLPLPDQELPYWEQIQDEEDAQDEEKRAEIERVCPLEQAVYSNQIAIKQSIPFSFPRPHQAQLSNGCELIWYHKDDLPLITIVVDFLSDYYFDPLDKQGLYNFMSRMLLEGTKQYTASELAQALEHAGISIDSRPGRMVMNLVSDSFEKALYLLAGILRNSTFTQSAIERVRAQIVASVRDYWDDPSEFIKQYAYEQVYKDHPYAKNEWGTVESVSRLTREDLISAYRTYISPQGTGIAIVGKLDRYDDVVALVEKYLGSWTGPVVEPLIFPALAPIKRDVFSYPAHRDQVVLGFVGGSVARTDPRYDALLLFDYIFAGGATGSMGSRLFALREKSGLFYTIGGSLLTGADEQPGMIFIKTVISGDVLAQVEKMIETEIDTSISFFGNQELARAQNAIINGLVDHVASNQERALSFLFLRRYGLNQDYFEQRADALSAFSVESVQVIVRDFLSTDRLIKIRIGRM